MRFISMRHFKSPAAVRMCIANRQTIVLGQIIGEVNGHIKKMGRLPDGTEQESIVLIGDFAGVCYEQQAKLVADGKAPEEAEFQAEALYMPKWYTEAVVTKLGANKRIEFAAEIIIAPTPEGQTIQYQYDVKSLIARPANSAVERMKRTLASKGVLRLSAPVALDPTDVRLIESKPEPGHDPETGEIAGDAPEPTGEDAKDEAVAKAEEQATLGATEPATSEAPVAEHGGKPGKHRK